MARDEIGCEQKRPLLVSMSSQMQQDLRRYKSGKWWRQAATL